MNLKQIRNIYKYKAPHQDPITIMNVYYFQDTHVLIYTFTILKSEMPLVDVSVTTKLKRSSVISF